MDGTNPKISFIPKGSLVREESFLERSRPRSVIGILAITVFVLVFGAYGALYFYNNSLNEIVAEKTTEITNAKGEFSSTPEVADAKLFRARADLAQVLLNAHIVASPVFEFLSQNTVASIFYDKFSFKNSGGASTLELSGEAPTYAALAYQIDVLQKQTKELTGLFVQDVSLSNFGNITFNLSLVFSPDYLLYTKNLNNYESPTSGLDNQVTTPATVVSTPITTPAVTSSVPSKATPTFGGVTTSSTSTEPAPGDIPGVESSVNPPATSTPVDVVPPSGPTEGAAVSTTVATPAKQSFFQAFWSKLKFW